MELVSEPSFLAGTEASHPQYDLSYRRSFARHCTQIYSPRDLLCLEEKCTPNKSTPRTFEEKKVPHPQRYYLVIPF